MFRVQDGTWALDGVDQWHHQGITTWPRLLGYRELAVQQIVSRAVLSTEIVDILAAAGLGNPDISILSDDFLAEVQEMDKKNLALEVLKRLLNDELRSRSRSNVVEAKRFSQHLEEAVARYHTNAVSTAQVIHMRPRQRTRALWR